MKTKQGISLPTSGIVQVIESGNTSIAKLRQLLEENYLKLFCRLKYYTHICGAKLHELSWTPRATDNALILSGLFLCLLIRYRRLQFPVYFSLRGDTCSLATGNVWPSSFLEETHTNSQTACNYEN